MLLYRSIVCSTSIYDIQANKVSLKPITLFHVNKKQVEVFSSSSLRSGSRTSRSLLPTLTSNYLCSSEICVSFVCLSLSMPKSKGRLKLFSFHFPHREFETHCIWFWALQPRPYEPRVFMLILYICRVKGGVTLSLKLQKKLTCVDSNSPEVDTT